MQKPILSIVYHSQHGHTAQIAQTLEAAINSTSRCVVYLISVEEALQKWPILHASDGIIFGCPTHFGNVSASFKSFMDATGAFWYKQLWKDKLAAAFTVSSSTCGDKLNTLQSIALFAAQHSMHWISLGVLPRYMNDEQTDGQNRLGTYLGLMMQSDNSQKSVHPFHPGDLLTLELFANRLTEVAYQFTKNKIKQNEPITN